jgi:hypothetical protein
MTLNKMDEGDRCKKSRVSNSHEERIFQRQTMMEAKRMATHQKRQEAYMLHLQ